ncbi:hypothetical protein THOM_2303 [Trachipleistophora hominis]|uniref:Uncharacterized protein n=1 Tax=Trachipleistophora hominis TaxID=72359 RepID=L7JTN5_TRAHO|nr:hypothetical protein THOM_2303 [Trachipleistophora hominis]
MLVYFLTFLCASSSNEDSNRKLGMFIKEFEEHEKNDTASQCKIDRGMHNVMGNKAHRESSFVTNFITTSYVDTNSEIGSAVCTSMVPSENEPFVDTNSEIGSAVCTSMVPSENEPLESTSFDHNDTVTQKNMVQWWCGSMSVFTHILNFDCHLNGKVLQSSGLKFKRIIQDVKQPNSVITIELLIKEDVMFRQLYSVCEAGRNIDFVALAKKGFSYLSYYKTDNDEMDYSVSTVQKSYSFFKRSISRGNSIKRRTLIPIGNEPRETDQDLTEYNRAMRTTKSYSKSLPDIGTKSNKSLVRRKFESFSDKICASISGRDHDSCEAFSSEFNAYKQSEKNRIYGKEGAVLNFSSSHGVVRYRMTMEFDMDKGKVRESSDMQQSLDHSEASKDLFVRNASFTLDLILFLAKYTNIGQKTGYNFYTENAKKGFIDELRNKIKVCGSHYNWQLRKLVQELKFLKEKSLKFLRDDNNLTLTQLEEYTKQLKLLQELTAFNQYIYNIHEFLDKITEIFNTFNLTLGRTLNNLNNLQNLIGKSALFTWDEQLLAISFGSTMNEVSKVSSTAATRLSYLITNTIPETTFEINSSPLENEDTLNASSHDTGATKSISEPYNTDRNNSIHYTPFSSCSRENDPQRLMSDHIKNLQNIRNDVLNLEKEMIEMLANLFFCNSFFKYVTHRFDDIINGK